MEAKLVYLVDDVTVELEKRKLESLDDFTYSLFKTEDEIINSLRYKKLLAGLPKNGELKIVYDSLDVPVYVGQYFVGLGYDIFCGEQSMRVLLGNGEVLPTKDSLKQTVMSGLTGISIVNEFYSALKDMYTPEEEMLYRTGIFFKSKDFLFVGLNRIINEVIDDDNGYFVGRLFLESIDKFNRKKNNASLSYSIIKK